MRYSILVLVITFLLTLLFTWIGVIFLSIPIFLFGMMGWFCLLLNYTWDYIKGKQFDKLSLMYVSCTILSFGFLYLEGKIIEAELSKLWYPGYRGTFTMEDSKADSLFACEYDIISSRKINLLDSVGTELKYAYVERSISSDSNYFVNIITSNYMKGCQEWWGFNEPGVIRQTADHNNPENKDCKIYKIYRKQLPPDTITFYMVRINDNSTVKDSTTVANDVLDSIVIVKKQ